MIDLLDTRAGESLQQRWTGVEEELWPCWEAGEQRPAPARQWRWGPAALVLARAVRPGWELLSRARLARWLAWLPDDDPLNRQLEWLRRGSRGSSGPATRRAAAVICWACASLLHRGYARSQEITDADLAAVPERVSRGLDALDAVLCAEGILQRSPRRGPQRRLPARPADAGGAGRRLADPGALPRGPPALPRGLRGAHQRRLRHHAPQTQLARAPVGLPGRAAPRDHQHGAGPARAHARVRRARDHPRARGPAPPPAAARRRGPHDGASVAGQRPLLLRRHLQLDRRGRAHRSPPWHRRRSRWNATTCVGVGFEKARRRQTKRQTAAIIDLEREIPKLRALAARRWQDATTILSDAPEARAAQRGEVSAFWDWALLELLLQSGLRIEEACELTTLDVLRRRHSDGRTYYLLHVKPSKFDRARVIPIGDGLGRVIAQIIVHVKRFYATSEVPACDGWDASEKRAGPHAPYLLQGAGHPSQIAYSQIRNRLARLSRQRRRRADGSALVLRPHDCRRAFASEHLNNNTPIHVIQALLGHASPDTVMVYAKLYPATLIDEYRKTVRAAYADFHGPDSLRAPDAAEWREFARSVELRDMGTHLCALDRARGAEPAGQLAARELEAQRISGALRRAQSLDDDVAAAIEAA